MASPGLVCPNCRTWFEGRGRRPRCPSCGQRVDEPSTAGRLARSTADERLQAPDLSSQTTTRPVPAPQGRLGAWDFFSALGFGAIGALLIWIALDQASTAAAVFGLGMLASAIFTMYALSRNERLGPTERFFAGAPKFTFGLLLAFSFVCGG